MTLGERQRYVQELATSGNPAFACVCAGVDRSAVQEERRDSHVFDEQCRRALKVAREHLRQRCETAA